MHSAPVSCRAEWNVPPAATIAFVTARLPLPIRPKTTSPPRRCSVRPTTSDTSIGGKLLTSNRMRTAAPWVLLGAATAGVALALHAAGMPSPTLFAAPLGRLTAALAGRAGHLAVPRGAFIAAQAVVGVTLGAYLQSSSLRAIAGSWLPVTLVSAGTLALSLGVGVLVARVTRLDIATATLGLVAGGASGIVTMASDLGADDRLVAFMQYMRVLVVVVLTPLLIALTGVHGGGSAPSAPAFGDLKGWLLTAVIAPAGAVVARRVN